MFGGGVFMSNQTVDWGKRYLLFEVTEYSVRDCQTKNVAADRDRRSEETIFTTNEICVFLKLSETCKNSAHLYL